ncbi:MAG: Dehydrogenase [Solirubrobacterales bacterium]|nr:Dehydrogenase [Solirubrobacterales bacterium]
MYDVIVAGGGHNGLTCGAYLAKAGRRVVVLERRDILGGMCTTEETVAEAPGFKMNPCAVDTALTNTPKSVIDELRLVEDFGLRFVTPDPWAAFISPDDAAIAMWRDRSRTVAEIARLSRKDAEKFNWLCEVMMDAWWTAMPYFQTHPTRPTPKAIGEVLWRAAKGRKSLRPALRLFANSPDQVIEEHFEREEVKAFLANLAAWSMLPLQEPGSGGVLAMMVAYFGWGVTRPVGGSGEFPKALARCIQAHGGEVRTGAGVQEILVRSDGVAEGVRLHDGQELRAKHVVGAMDPQTLVGDLVDQAYVPDTVKGELRALGVLRWNISVIKADVAITETPQLKCGRQELLNGYLMLSPTIESVRRDQLQSMAGELPDGMTMAPMFPSYVDRSQVPPGSKGETIYLYMQAVPMKLSGGRDWADHKDDYVRRVIGEMDRYMPGLAGSVIGQYVQGPDELAKKTFRGNVVHVDMSMHQMGPWRPTPSLAGYRTPVENLWHTAAGAHPMGALNGWSGRTTARTVERVLRKAKDASSPVSVPVAAPAAAVAPSTNGHAPDAPRVAGRVGS